MTLVEDDGYFLTVLRYIHQNPVKAKICKKAENYPYSSMGAYLTFSALVDTEFALSIISREQFIEYHAEVNEDKCLDIEEHFRLTDDEAKVLIAKIAKCKSASDFQELDMKTRNSCIYKLHRRGLSIRQISRLTGISKKIVELNVN